MTTTMPRGPRACDLLRSMHNRSLGWPKAIGELIDNSVGNGAKTVTVRFDPHAFRVCDDGVGCTAKMFAALASIGWHEEDDLVTNTVSRYGIGAKDAFVWAGGPTRLYSRRNSVCRFLEVDWESFGKNWDYDVPVTGRSAEASCRKVKLTHDGTVIVQPHLRRQMNEKIFNGLFDNLNDQHWAAVESGVIIRLEFKRRGKRGRLVSKPLPGKAMPAILEGNDLDTIVTLSDGRQVRIVGGILDPNERLSSPGFTYIYGHRVVIPAGGVGAGDCGFERVYFRVFLLGDKSLWNVTTNKTGLHESDEAVLAEAIFAASKALLAKAQSQEFANVLDQDLLDEVSEMLTEAHRKRAKRRASSGRQGKAGTIRPTGRGAKHKRAELTGDEPGNCRPRRPFGRIRVLCTPFEDIVSHLVGKANVPDKVVRLNELHPFVDEIKATRDRHRLSDLATTLWSDEWIRTEEQGQRRLSGVERTSFVDKLSAMLKGEMACTP